MMGRAIFSLAPLYPNVYITKRQAECLVVLVETCGTREDIAKKLGISPKTVENHLKKLREKLHCRSKKDLIMQLSILPWKIWAEQINSLNRQS